MYLEEEDTRVYAFKDFYLVPCPSLSFLFIMKWGASASCIQDSDVFCLTTCLNQQRQGLQTQLSEAGQYGIIQAPLKLFSQSDIFVRKLNMKKKTEIHLVMMV